MSTVWAVGDMEHLIELQTQYNDVRNEFLFKLDDWWTVWSSEIEDAPESYRDSRAGQLACLRIDMLREMIMTLEKAAIDLTDLG
jgi:hypothetical protein